MWRYGSLGGLFQIVERFKLRSGGGEGSLRVELGMLRKFGTFFRKKLQKTLDKVFETRQNNELSSLMKEKGAP